MRNSDTIPPPSDEERLSATQEPPASLDAPDSDGVRTALEQLRLEVRGVHQFQKGLTAFFAIVAVFAAIVIAFLGWLGISDAVDRNIANRVQASVDEGIAQVSSELDGRVTRADSALATVEGALLRVEAFSTQSASSAATAQSGSDLVNIMLTQIAGPSGAGEWIVAIASSSSLDEALGEVDRALRAGYAPLIYFFDNYYVSGIGPFASREQADVARLAIDRKLQGAPALYDLRISCPFRNQNEKGFLNCYLQPASTPTP